MRTAWRAIHERLQVALGATDSEILEHVAARIHDGNDDACQELTSTSAAVIEMKAMASTPMRPASTSRTIETSRPAATGIVPAAQIQDADPRLVEQPQQRA